MIGIQAVLVNPCTLDQSFQSRIFCASQHLKTFFDKNTVLIFQIHHVSDRSDRNIFDQIIQIRRILSHTLPQCLHHLVCNCSTAESFKWIETIRLLRIHNRICRRNSVSFFSIVFIKRDLMVICYDHCHPHFFSIRDFICCRDPIITGNERIYTGFISSFDQMPVQSISVTDTVWYITVHIRTETFQSLQQNVSCIHSVYIIISDHPDFLIFQDLLFQNIDCFIHIFHQHSIIQITDCSIQIAVNRFFPDHIPVPDQTCQPRADLVFFPYCLKICAFPQQNPSFHCCRSFVSSV